MTTKKDIRQLSLSDLQTIFINEKQAKFRANQVFEWLWAKGVRTFDEMTNLSKELRLWLEEHFIIHDIKIIAEQRSNDGTIKLALQMHDGAIVEGVLIPSENRMTACVSSQVGCSLNCSFCATGFLKRQRNLTASEIFDQVWLINQLALINYHKPLSNIVFMGMGEPLLNYANVIESINRITGTIGMGMSAQRITVSTAGIAKMIKKLGDDNVKFNLALSLHAANNTKRSAIMPINDSNPIEDLIDALNYFYQKTKNKITLEYAVIDSTNDSEEELEDLVKFARKVPCKINLIEYNPIDLAQYKSSEKDKIIKFAEKLRKHNLIANVRRSRGKDIDAACGQLANKH